MSHVDWSAHATVRRRTWGTIPLGAVAGGILGTAIGLQQTILISSAGGLVALAILAASPLRSLREIPAFHEPEPGLDPTASVSAPPTGV